MTLTRNNQLEFDFQDTGQSIFDGYPSLLIWIQQLMPDLLNNSKRSASLLEAIFAFLFKQKKRCPSLYLKRGLSEELYYYILGLKSILIDQHHNWNKTKNYLKEHQKNFPLLLEELV